MSDEPIYPRPDIDVFHGIVLEYFIRDEQILMEVMTRGYAAFLKSLT